MWNEILNLNNVEGCYIKGKELKLSFDCIVDTNTGRNHRHKAAFWEGLIVIRQKPALSIHSTLKVWLCLFLQLQGQDGLQHNQLGNVIENVQCYCAGGEQGRDGRKRRRNSQGTHTHAALWGLLNAEVLTGLWVYGRGRKRAICDKSWGPGLFVPACQVQDAVSLVRFLGRKS